jgi:AcrR family transcriptional regulator
MSEDTNSVRKPEPVSARRSAAPPVDRREARRRQTRDEIVAAAWDLVRENGLAGLAMRELGQRVGMKAQSIYSYFDSKNDIYDAMFHEGYLAFGEELSEVSEAAASDVRQVAHRYALSFFRFCTSDPVRYQLLFQRTVPDFVPSEESWAVALGVYESFTEQFASIGAASQELLDLWTAMLTGLTDQQISNDPGGDRWERLLDRAVDMLLREIAPDHFDHQNGGSKP